MSAKHKHSKKSAQLARGGEGTFLPMPTVVLKSDDIAKLSPFAAKLLIDIASQFRYGNNGDQSASWTLMKERGWRSKATLNKALTELKATGLIVMTRQGGMGRCSLYGLGWLAIDDCKGKLDIKPTSMPMKLWHEKIVIKNNKSPSTGNVPTMH